MQKKLMLIVNPNAGRSGYKSGFAEALKILDDGGYRATCFFTKGKGDATDIVKQYGKEYDTVVCMGGDGTLSEVIAGLMHVENPPELGYMPMGTANDVATSLGLPKNDAPAAARIICTASPRPYDVGGFGKDEYFSYIAAFGAFTAASYETPQELKKTWGHLAYVLQGAAELKNIESIRTKVEYDDGTIEADLVYGSMSNSTSVAGIVRLKDGMVCFGDGMSELVLVKDPGGIDGIGEILASVLSGKFDSDKLMVVHTKRAKFTFEKEVAWTRDGEPGGEHQCVELCNYPYPIQFIF